MICTQISYHKNYILENNLLRAVISISTYYSGVRLSDIILRYFTEFECDRPTISLPKKCEQCEKAAYQTVLKEWITGRYYQPTSVGLGFSESMVCF
jgi:hypothetical protein